MIINSYKSEWNNNLLDISRNPILRTYNIIKSEFKLEPYLSLVKHTKYRTALCKLRASSHTLEIERGRYTRPKTPVECRSCNVCHVIEDELHFLVDCKMHESERNILFNRISISYSKFTSFNRIEKFKFLLTKSDPQLLTWVGKFIHNAFEKRNSLQL